VRVVVDARSAVAPHPTGIGLYTRELLRRMPGLDPGTSYTAWYLNAKGWAGGPRHLLRDLGAPSLRERETHFPARWFAKLEGRFDAPRIEWLTRFDVLFAPNFIPPPTRSRRVVVTVHDLAFKRFPETAPHGTRWWLERLDETLRRAAHVIVPSHATETDLLELYRVEPERVSVIPHGVDREVFRPAPEEDVARVRARFGIDGPYLLVLGGIEPRKNLPRIVEAWSRLDDDVRPALVIAGASVAWNPEGTRALSSALDALRSPVREQVILTGYVSRAQSGPLLTGAVALVFPSLYEGFGLPVLEAMACGTPVITSNRSSLPEVASDAALLVDPESVNSIAGAMGRMLQDEATRRDLVAKGTGRVAAFSWDETARKTAEIMRAAGS
jgi:glycosyltransferase involved in cell wall biosynthesis